MSLCKDCVSGVTHEGTPQGKFEDFSGVECYVATPSGDYDQGKVLLFLPDVFGVTLINNQLLADDFAKNGFKTILVDYLNKDPIHPDALNPGSNFDLMGWLGKHGSEVTEASLYKVINLLKQQGVNEFAATGYCFGGRYVFNLAFKNEIKVGVTAHPSLLKIPDDLKTYVEKSSTPLLINSCEVDTQFPIEAQKQADEIFKDFKPGYKREYFAGCTHGFAVRGDISKPEIKAGKEGAFKASVEWLLNKF